MRQLALLAGAAVVLASALHADYLEVSRSATIKRDHDGDAEILDHVQPPTQLALVPVPDGTNDQVEGYYLVERPGGQGRGWIFRTLVRRYPGTMPQAETTGEPATGFFEVHVINVGQADAILLRCPEGTHQMLIDAGDTRYPGSSTQFRAYMTNVQDVADPIEVVVASHPHADHIGSMPWVLDTYQVGLYVDNGNVYDSANYRRVEEAYARHQPGYWSAQDDDVPQIDFCPRMDLSAQVLVPDGFGQHSDPNENSVIVRVDFGSQSFLFVGDGEHEAEAELLADPDTAPLVDVDFLKVGHHGSDTSSTVAFLDAVSPQIAAISCGTRDVGTNTGYRHPRLVTLQNLLARVDPRLEPARTVEGYSPTTQIWTAMALTGQVYTTAADGDLVFHSDGARTWLVR